MISRTLRLSPRVTPGALRQLSGASRESHLPLMSRAISTVGGPQSLDVGLVKIILNSPSSNEEKAAYIAKLLMDRDKRLMDKDELLMDKDELLMDRDKAMDGLLAERDFLKGTLQARHVIENFELFVMSSKYKGPRVKKWTDYLEDHPPLMGMLREIDPEADWPVLISDIYRMLSLDIHHQPVRTGASEFLLMISKNHPDFVVQFVKLLVQTTYHGKVRVALTEDRVEEV